MLFSSFVRFQRWSRILRPTSRSGEMCVRWAARALCGGGRKSASGSLARRGLQHIGACQSAALYAADTVREVRGASERRADGAGRARAAHAHHVAPHLILCGARLRRRRLALSNGMEETISRPLGPQSKNRFDGCNRKDTARAAVTADFDHAELSQLELSSQ